jgi:hypothetical protein
MISSRTTAQPVPQSAAAVNLDTLITCNPVSVTAKKLLAKALNHDVVDSTEALPNGTIIHKNKLVVIPPTSKARLAKAVTIAARVIPSLKKTASITNNLVQDLEQKDSKIFTAMDRCVTNHEAYAVTLAKQAQIFACTALEVSVHDKAAMPSKTPSIEPDLQTIGAEFGSTVRTCFDPRWGKTWCEALSAPTKPVQSLPEQATSVGRLAVKAGQIFGIVTAVFGRNPESPLPDCLQLVKNSAEDIAHPDSVLRKTAAQATAPCSTARVRALDSRQAVRDTVNEIMKNQTSKK